MGPQGKFFSEYSDKKNYNVGIYLRLSKEDETAGHSESISNQRDYIISYVSQQGWNIAGIYIDDGFSGLNFDRPAFKRMIEDIENKKVNLVITKDLSRLGRDYIDTGYYLERYFPKMKVRYIALSDGIDTFSNTSNNDISPFKSVINDLYAKDISKKIRTVMDTKRKNGQFIGAFAPYGYKKDPDNKNKLVIDDEAAAVVRRIFSMYLKGESMYGIKKTLNIEKVPSPAKYKETNSTYRNPVAKRYLWTNETVKRILTNPSYMGNMAQGRQVKINYKVEKYRKIPPEDWIVVENTHEPIISREEFLLAQEMLRRRMVHYDKGEKAFHLLNGLLFCGACGSKMTFRKNSSNKMIAICTTYNKYGPGQCTSHLMREDILEDAVITELKKIAGHVLKERFYEELSKFKPQKADPIDKELVQINKLISQTKDIIKSLYIDKVKGLIDEDMFLHMSEEYNQRNERLRSRYAQLLEMKNHLEKSKDSPDYIRIIKEISNFDRPDKFLLSALIERIEITDNREINIYYRFQNPYK